jgi:hypothetical protein
LQLLLWGRASALPPGFRPAHRRRISSKKVRTAFLTALILAACGPAPPPPQPGPRDETKEPWYPKAAEQLSTQNREAQALIKSGKPDAAADLIQRGEPLAGRLLAVRNPTLAAMEAASDLDDLYGSMLLSNRNYGWAMLFFQKNQSRWKTWQPQTPDTAARLKAAQSAIAECERRLSLN